ncbi:hypothetical protein PC129_g14641 [Phytophthora cactorum]|uniref:Uncharacterized protein n=1 Tax=Phytophthora cactorum TaxID=29920 RepID=A0A8T1HQE3_9STRA|nr:hypothetical protein PC129_g14641 [Phytophthora cactorum]
MYLIPSPSATHNTAYPALCRAERFLNGRNMTRSRYSNCVPADPAKRAMIAREQA